MPRLLEGSLAVFWPRHAIVTHPELPFARVDLELAAELGALAAGQNVEVPPRLAAQLGPHLTQGLPIEEDAVLRARLAELDRAYTGWIPGLWARSGDLIEAAEARHARRRVLLTGRAGRPTLPASTVRRALILGELTAKSILLEQDDDGLAVLLARDAEVTVIEPHPWQRAWLTAEAARAGVGARLHVIERWPETAQFDLTLVHGRAPAPTHDALRRTVAVTRHGGSIAVALRAPLEAPLLDQVAAAGMPVRGYHRDLDHWLLPGPVVASAGDLLLLDRPAGVTLTAVADDDAQRLRSQPHLAIDIDGVAPERDDAIARLADLVGLASARPEEARSIQRRAEHEVLGWYDDAGSGFTAELRRLEEHMLLTLLPYDAELEYAVLAAVYQTVADRLTRARPLRTRTHLIERALERSHG